MRRLLCVLLALAALCGLAAAADGGCQLTVSKIQRLTPGTAFDPDTAPEVTDVSPGDILVLTVALQNDTDSAVDILGFVVKLLYDAEKVTPFTGVAPFDDSAYQISDAVAGRRYQWIPMGNSTKRGFISVVGSGTKAYTIPAGETLVCARMAFQVNADAAGEALFTLDTAKTNVTNAALKKLPLAAFQPVRVTLGSYEITAVSAERVTLSNPAPVTLAVSYFDADGKFISASTQSVPADAGSVPVAFGNASKAYVMLFDEAFRPLCERCLYVMK